MAEKQKRKRRTFDAEFKQNAVDLVAKQGYTLKAASDALDVDVSTLRAWHRKLVSPPESVGDDATLAEVKAENARLRRQLQRVEMEREILKKATAFFAKEST